MERMLGGGYAVRSLAVEPKVRNAQPGRLSAAHLRQRAKGGNSYKKRESYYIGNTPFWAGCSCA